MAFSNVFDACVALQNGDEVTAWIDGERLVAFALEERFVLALGSTLVREGDAFDVALAFVRACDALVRGRKRPPRKSSSTRLVAQAAVPLGVPSRKRGGE